MATALQQATRRAVYPEQVAGVWARYRTSDKGRATARACRLRIVERNKAIMAEHLDRGCVDCGGPGEHFHHLDPTTKTAKVSRLKTASIGVLTAEIEKCIVVCEVCHRRRHA